MADLAASVKVADGGGAAKRIARREIIGRQDNFKRVPTIFLPRVLHRDESKPEGYRVLDYDRDILGHLDWESFHFFQADSVSVDAGDKLNRTIARIDIERTGEEGGRTLFDFAQEKVEDLPDEGLDVAYLVRQLLDVIPNPWQGMRILTPIPASGNNEG